MKRTIYTIILVVCILILSGCGNESLIGKWKRSGYSYTFNEDKTCEYVVLGLRKECSYEVSDDKLIISYEGTNSSFEYKYKIEKNVLHIYDSLGSNIEYTKE